MQGNKVKTTIHVRPALPAAEQERLRVSAYCRVSTNDQETSITAQRQHYEGYIKAHPDWIFSGIYWEAGISGTKTGERPELQRLIADCKARRVDLVLVKSLSRFSRDTAACLELVRTLTSFGVGIIFQKENLDTRSMGSEFLLTLFSSIAEEESRSISTNSKWSVQKRFQAGTCHFSKAPYGYLLQNGTFVVEAEQAAVVREIFGQVLQGQGSGLIARALNERGIPTGTKRRDGREGQWNSSMVLGIIKNVTYTGDVLMQKTYGDLEYRRHKNRGQQPQYYHNGHHEAIIDYDTFERANLALVQRGREKGTASSFTDSAGYLYPETRGVPRKSREDDPHRNRYAFSGKLVCDSCGEKFKRITGRANGKKRYYWGCKTHTGNASACPMKREQEESLWNAFFTMMNKLAYAALPEIYLDLLTQEEMERLGAEAEKLKERKKRIISEKERLTLLLRKGCGEPLFFRQRLTTLEAEEAALEKERERAGGESTEMKEALLLKTVVHSWKSGKVREGDPLFSQIVGHVTVNTGKSVTFHLKCGLHLTESLDRTL